MIAAEQFAMVNCRVGTARRTMTSSMSGGTTMLREIFENLKKTPEERQAAWEQALYKKMNNISQVEERKILQVLPKPDLLTQLHQDRDKMDRIQKYGRMGWDRWVRVHDQPGAQESEGILLLECGRHPSKEVRLLECSEHQSNKILLLGCVNESEQIPLVEFVEHEPTQYNRPVHGNRRNH